MAQKKVVKKNPIKKIETKSEKMEMKNKIKSTPIKSVKKTVVKPTPVKTVKKGVVKLTPAETVKKGVSKQNAFISLVESYKKKDLRPFLKYLAIFLLGVFSISIIFYVIIAYHIFSGNNKISKHRGYPLSANQEVQSPEKKPCPCKAKVEPGKRKVAFNPEEYKPYDGKSETLLKVNACFDLPDGTVCDEKIRVFVNPVTSYSEEWFRRYWVGNELLENPDERAWAYNKMGKQIEQGVFIFKDLPSGDYFVAGDFCAPIADNPEKCIPTRFAKQITLVDGRQMSANLVAVFTDKPRKSAVCPTKK